MLLCIYSFQSVQGKFLSPIFVFFCADCEILYLFLVCASYGQGFAPGSRTIYNNGIEQLPGWHKWGPDNWGLTTVVLCFLHSNYSLQFCDSSDTLQCYNSSTLSLACGNITCTGHFLSSREEKKAESADSQNNTQMLPAKQSIAQQK